MIVDRNTAMPLPAGTTPGKGGTAAQPASPDRSAWLREMEKQEMTGWLSHPATQAGRAAPLAPALYARVSPPALAPAPSAPAGGADSRAGIGQSQSSPDQASSGARDADIGDGAASAGKAWDRGHGRRRDGAERRSEAPADDAGEAAAAIVPAAGQEAAASALPNLAAAVMAALAQAPDPGAAGVQAPRSAPALPAGGRVNMAEIQVAAVPTRSPELPSPASAQRLPQAAPGGEPAGEAKPSTTVQGRRAPGIEQPAMPEATPAPLRIHTVRTASGVKVWIGADLAAGLSGQQLLLAAGDIRRLLREQGTALESLVYNGEAVFDGEDTADGRDGIRAPQSKTNGGLGPRTGT